MLVDNSLSDTLKSEFERFEIDLAGDGWVVKKIYIPRTEKFNSESVTKIKKLIFNEYRNSGGELKSLILFGRIAVPYSGNYAFDGHIPNHFGAWACDVYYGVFDDDWTDQTCNNNRADRTDNWNLPFDGKFDQSVIYSSCKLQIGRIDFYNLPNFKESEIELYRRYLNKNHDFRNRNKLYPQKALIDDGFGTSFGTPYATNAWMCFSALVGPDSIEKGSYVPSLEKSSYIWSYGCNQGSYNSMLSTLYTDQLAKLNINGVFAMYLGSYLGDFDSEDNLMRAAIASNPSIIVCFWGGRPFWFLHQMGLGETIGYQTKLTQNNDVVYESSSTDGSKGIQIALMGDPTLRMHVVAPITNFELSKSEIIQSDRRILQFNWKEPNDEFLGFNIYRSEGFGKRFYKLNNSTLTTTNYSDTIPANKKAVYMVRTLKLQQTPTGSYYNQSQGTFINSDGTIGVNEELASVFSVSPNPANEFLNISLNQSLGLNCNIKILDLTGRVVKTFKNNYMDRNTELITWDLTNDYGGKVNNGIYFISVFNGFDAKLQKCYILRDTKF